MEDLRLAILGVGIAAVIGIYVWAKLRSRGRDAAEDLEDWDLQGPDPLYDEQGTGTDAPVADAQRYADEGFGESAEYAYGDEAEAPMTDVEPYADPVTPRARPAPPPPPVGEREEAHVSGQSRVQPSDPTRGGGDAPATSRPSASHPRAPAVGQGRLALGGNDPSMDGLAGLSAVEPATGEVADPVLAGISASDAPRRVTPPAPGARAPSRPASPPSPALPENPSLPRAPESPESKVTATKPPADVAPAPTPPAVGVTGLESDLPEQYFVLNVLAQVGRRFEGVALTQALAAAGMKLGDRQLYHYREPGTPADAPPLFTALNVIKPGTLDARRMANSSTPGIALVMRLPQAAEPTAVFDTMYHTAQSLVRKLGGRLCDETRSTLSNQALNHMREQVVEYARRSRLR